MLPQNAKLEYLETSMPFFMIFTWQFKHHWEFLKGVFEENSQYPVAWFGATSEYFVVILNATDVIEDVISSNNLHKASVLLTILPSNELEWGFNLDFITVE